jgi:hypothetical protein
MDVERSGTGALRSFEVAASTAPMPPRAVFVALTFGGSVFNTSHVAECPDLGPQCAGVAVAPPAGTAMHQIGPEPYHHKQTIVAADAVLDVQTGVLPWLGFAATIPLRTNTSRVRFFALDGHEIQPDPPDTHHRNRTLVGLGDPTLVAIVGRTIGRFGVALRLGSMLPLAGTLDEDPYRAGREGHVHEHVQFGTGTFRPVVGSSIGFDLGAVGVDAWFLATLSAYANGAGYRSGHRIGGGTRVSSALGTKTWRVGTGVEVMRETREDWGGAQNADGNLGRTDVLAVLTARWSPAPMWGLFVSVRLPLYVDVVGAQLQYPAVLQFGVATSFGL